MHSPLKQSDIPEKITIKDFIQTASSIKVVVLLIVGSCIVLAALYSIFKQKNYEAETQVLPPTPANLSAYNTVVTLLNRASPEHSKTSLNQNTSPWVEVSPIDAYNIFLRHATSNTTKKIFFQEHYLPHYYQNPSEEQKEILWQQLSKNLRIITQQDETGSKATIKLKGTEPELTSSWVNTYTQLALSESQQQLQSTLQSMLSAQQSTLSQELIATQHSAEDERQRYIARLEDALKVAQSIDLIYPPNSGNLVTSYSDENLYLRGTKALESELAVTRARSNNFPYTPELVKLNQRQYLLNQASTQSQDITTAIIDSEARPISKSTDLPLSVILIVGAISGILLSLCLVAGITSWRINQRP